MPKSKMYANTKTWNPLKGCRFDCAYCKPTFQRQAKRQLHNCQDCYEFVPHFHPERLDKIPSTPTVFACGNGDISFAHWSVMWSIIAAIKRRNAKHPEQTYLFQSKRPEYFRPFLGGFPSNVILGTTLETNRDKGYRAVSKAPLPSTRYRQFKALDYPRKFVTVEPVMAFDACFFAGQIHALALEHVWVGFNSKPKSVVLPEPTVVEVGMLIKLLLLGGNKVRGKDLRGIKLEET